MTHYMIVCKHTDGTSYSAELPYPCFKHEMIKAIADGQVGDVQFVYAVDTEESVVDDATRRITKELSNRQFEDLSPQARDLCARFGFNIEGADMEYAYQMLAYSKYALNWGCPREEVKGPIETELWGRAIAKGANQIDGAFDLACLG